MQTRATAKNIGNEFSISLRDGFFSNRTENQLINPGPTRVPSCFYFSSSFFFVCGTGLSPRLFSLQSVFFFLAFRIGLYYFWPVALLPNIYFTFFFLLRFSRLHYEKKKKKMSGYLHRKLSIARVIFVC